MQNVYYIDSNFIKENSFQYILSIRYATDGLSFCIHEENDRLLAFFHQPLTADTPELLRQQILHIISGNYLLKLNYRQVYLLNCQPGKLLVPASSFQEATCADFYRMCIRTAGSDTFTWYRMDTPDSYLMEHHSPRLVTFLEERYPGVKIINSAAPFIRSSLAQASFNAPYFFIDIHPHYFDLLLTQSNSIRLFNTFSYSTYTDIIYYLLNCLQQQGTDRAELQTVISGNHVGDKDLLSLLNRYVSEVTVLDNEPLARLLKDRQLEPSVFLHLLNIHKCV